MVITDFAPFSTFTAKTGIFPLTGNVTVRVIAVSSKPENDHVRNFTSRYNHYGPGIHNHANGEQYGDCFLYKRVDSICTLLGITKEKFFQLFKFKLDDDVDIANIMKKIVKGDFVGGRNFSCHEQDNEFGRYYIIQDRTTGFQNIFKNGKFILPWSTDIFNGTIGDFMYFYAIKDDKRQFFDENGNPLLPTPLSASYNFYVDKHCILRITANDKIVFYDLKNRRWLTPTPINAKVDHSWKSDFPYIRIINPETNERKMHRYNVKTHTLDLVHLEQVDNKPILIMNDNFAVDNNVKVYCRKANKLIDMHNDVFTHQIVGCLSDYFFGTNKHYVTADGTEVQFSRNENFNATIVKGKKKITVTYERIQENAELFYKYRFYNANGDKIYEFDAINVNYTNENSNNLLIYTYFKRGDNTTLCYTAVTIDGEITNKTVENIKVREYSGREYFFIANNGKIYGKNLEVLSDLETEVDSVREIFTIDQKYGWYRITVWPPDFNKKSWMFNINAKKLIPIKNDDSPFILMGFGYIFLPGEKLTDPARLIDDEGRVVFDDVYKFVTGFDNNGIASFKGRRNRMLYINTDNEMSDTLEELVESMECKKFGKILNEGMEIQQKINWLDIAAYFC